MATKQKITKQELKDLIDDLPETELLAAKRYLQFLNYLDDPLEMSLAEAPLDDEEVTVEDIAAFRETDEDFRTGKSVPFNEVKKEFGL